MPAALINKLEKVRGMNDVLPEEYAACESILSGLKGAFRSFGYRAVDVPVVEQTDLYLRKAGEDIIARLYDFTFQNRRLCLRPEMTASIIRAYIDNLQASALPLRLCYSGPVFRYEKPQRGRQRQFTQVGVELIGAAGPLADAEVVALACRGLEAVKITNYQVVVGHVGILARFLAGLQLDSRLRAFLLANLEAIRSRGVSTILERLPSLFPSMLPGDAQQPDSSQPLSPETNLESLLSSLAEADARSLILDLLKSMEIELDSARPADEIAARLLAKVKRRSQAPRLDQALKFLEEVCRLSGAPGLVLQSAEGLLTRFGISLEPLLELKAIFQALENYGLDPARFTLDLGLSRGLQYYTGMIFEIYHGSPDEERQLCGGGRYDDLVLTLGGNKSVPGFGFSYGLERILLATQEENLPVAAAQGVDALVIPVSQQESGSCIRAAEALRRRGLAVEIEVRGRSVTSSLHFANHRRIPFVIVIGSDETSAGLVRLKTMSTGQEAVIPIEEAARVIVRGIKTPS